MKKLVLLCFLAVALGMLASAATISCTVTSVGPLTSVATASGPNTGFSISQGNSGGTITTAISCPGIDAGAGNQITSAMLLGTGDYQGGPFGTTAGTAVTEVFGISSTPFGTAAVTQVISGGNSSTGSVPPTPFQIGSTIAPNTQTTSGFTVSISSAVTAGGPVANSSGQVVESFTIGLLDTTVPEPASLCLIGAALVGLGLRARSVTQRR